MITKSYEFGCENCGHADHWFGDKADGLKHFRREEWIITADEQVFCTKDCYKEFKGGK